MAAAAVLSPVIAYLIGGPGYGTFSGSFGTIIAMIAAGALYAFAVGAISRLMQLGLGAAVGGLLGSLLLIFVNFPSSGGSVAPQLLPGFWRFLNHLQIEDRLNQLLAEVERLRGALAALDQRSQPSAASGARSRPSGAARPRRRAASRTRGRTPPGATKARVLEALSSGEAMTAGEVAGTTGLGRGSVSTTLSKLARSGEVRKAGRGYMLPMSTGTGVGDTGGSEARS